VKAGPQHRVPTAKPKASSKAPKKRRGACANE
jgi:hypothetical protein